MPHDLSQTLSDLVEREGAALRSFPENQASDRRSGPSSWSPKEELGHLIDSAVNNHARFVLACLEPEFHGPKYAQDEWVSIHGYQDMPWPSIIEFWVQYNTFIADLIARVPNDKLTTLCFIGEGEPVTLRFLIEDYMLHAQHHLDHLLRREKVTRYPS
ncbi:MAG TPA: DinB family protein [Bryobacteraceae bacterium]|nr:DinB family protein [Bryobacteraceae bacterium]